MLDSERHNESGDGEESESNECSDEGHSEGRRVEESGLSLLWLSISSFDSPDRAYN